MLTVKTHGRMELLVRHIARCQFARHACLMTFAAEQARKGALGEVPTSPSGEDRVVDMQTA